MRKRISLGLATIILGTALVACGNQNAQDNNQPINNAATLNEEKTTQAQQSDNNKQEKPTKADSSNIDGSADAITNLAAEYKGFITDAENEYDGLVKDIKTYGDYVKSVDKVSDFYENLEEEHSEICQKMYVAALSYAEAIVNSSDSRNDKYSKLKAIYDDIYDDIAKDLYDDVYDGILKDIYKDFYDGIIKDAYDTEGKKDYSSWYDIRSEEYDMWYDTRSDIYDMWYDTRSDIYDFCYDLRSAVYDDNDEKVQKKIDKFEEKIAKLSK